MKPKEEPREPLAPTPETDAAFDIRHTKTCTIAHFRQVMEKMERERDKALADLAAVAPPATKAKPKVRDIPCVLHPTIDIVEEVAP
jgi:hypothetical protein